MENFLDIQGHPMMSCKKVFVKKSNIGADFEISVSEFADYELEEIEKKYRETELAINTIPLDDTLDIKGKNAES